MKYVNRLDKGIRMVKRNLIVATVVCYLLLISLCNCHSSDENNSFINTVWHSTQPLTVYSWNGKSNDLILTFYKDSVNFDVPNGSLVDVAELLGGIAGGKEKHYSWNYKVTGAEVILDPGLLGYAIHLKRSGDSLIWQGDIPVPLEYLSLKKQPLQEPRP